MDKSNFYIDALKLTASKMDTGGIKFTEFYKQMKAQGYTPPTDEPGDNSISDHWHDFFVNTTNPEYETPPVPGEPRCIITIDSYFQLLEHEELHDARVSSKRAMIIATIAIALNVIGLFPQFYKYFSSCF